MYKVKALNGTASEFEISFDAQDKNSGIINGKAFQWDLVAEKPGRFHVLKDNKSYTIEVVYADSAEKKCSLKVNGNSYSFELKDKYDELLKNLGLDKLVSGVAKELKAPMPGLVLDVLVKAGDAVKKGDSILVLEAMKMENNIKAVADAVIKKIAIQKGNAVEKNQVLVLFE
jgi:biotin carboxyl carrier protein